MDTSTISASGRQQVVADEVDDVEAIPSSGDSGWLSPWSSWSNTSVPSLLSPYFVMLILTIVSVAVMYALNRRYRTTLFELRQTAEANKAKYELLQLNMDEMNVELNRLRTTIVQRDAEIAQLKNKGETSATG